MKKKRTRECKLHIGIERIVLGNGTTRCPACLKEKNKKIIENCIKKARKIHGDLYDYSLVDFKTIYEKTEIICRKHGVFKQHIYNHIKGRGCPICNIEKLKSPTEHVIEKFKKTHGDNYDYSLMKYVNTNTKIKIICKEHGVFEQVPAKHISGQGCPNCKLSHGEEKVKRFLQDNSIMFKQQKIFTDCVNPISKNKLKFDFYLPMFNMCIEYDGEQHFVDKYYTAKSGGLSRIRINDNVKNEYCKDKGIKLLRISYKDFKSIEKIIKENICYE